jgi:hypothetical protein
MGKRKSKERGPIGGPSDAELWQNGLSVQFGLWLGLFVLADQTCAASPVFLSADSFLLIVVPTDVLSLISTISHLGSQSNLSFPTHYLFS